MHNTYIGSFVGVCMKVEKGSKVKVEYTGTFDDGTVFDTSKHEGHSHPLEFEAGAGQVIPGFDSAVMGMEKGEKKKFRIEKKDAYGDHKEELVKEFPRKELPEDVNKQVKEDMLIGLAGPDGQQIPAKVVKLTEDTLTLDLNNPMAGKDLNFEIEVVEITPKN